MKNYLKKIKIFFDENNLSLTKQNTLSIRDKHIKDLKLLVPEYEKYARNGSIYLTCQNRINDFIVMLQIFYKKNYVAETKKKKEKE